MAQAKHEKTTAAFATVQRGQPDFSHTLTCDGTNLKREHRGVIDGKARVLQPCSIRFLHLLCLEIMRARAFPYVSLQRNVNQKQQIKRLQLLKQEIARLTTYPALFPSAIVRGRFLCVLALDAELAFTAACKDLLIEKNLQTYDKGWQDQITRPTYLKESHGWENFLLNKAPGCSTTPKKTNPKSAFQLLPSIAGRIVADYEKEETEIVRFVQNAEPKLRITPAASTLLINFDKPNPDSERWPGMPMTYVGRTELLRGFVFKDWRKLRCDFVRPGPEDLREFSVLTHRMEQPLAGIQGPVAALNTPNFWSHVALRTFLPGTNIDNVEWVDERL